jgi:hypothetical protein
MKPILLIHIAGGTLGLLFGYIALYSAKGAKVHRKSGMLFVYAMLVMALLGALMSAQSGVWTPVNVPAGLITAYLVVTGLTTVKPPLRGGRSLHLAGLTMVGTIAAMEFLFGFQAIAAGGKRNGIPAFAFFLFAIIGSFATIGDLRLLRSGPLVGSRRLVRHLWRMNIALFVAGMSASSRLPRPLMIFVLAALVTMFYWMWRLRAKKNRPDVAVTAASAGI